MKKSIIGLTLLMSLSSLASDYTNCINNINQVSQEASYEKDLEVENTENVNLSEVISNIARREAVQVCTKVEKQNNIHQVSFYAVGGSSNIQNFYYEIDTTFLNN